MRYPYVYCWLLTTRTAVALIDPVEALAELIARVTYTMSFGRSPVAFSAASSKASRTQYENCPVGVVAAALLYQSALALSVRNLSVTSEIRAEVASSLPSGFRAFFFIPESKQNLPVRGIPQLQHRGIVATKRATAIGVEWTPRDTNQHPALPGDYAPLSRTIPPRQRGFALEAEPMSG
ncbi:hypothetical protein [Stratiformator vulcanicus]|uniref:Uncharacterized protein n=1 Tax=Stratiformator vulcanicus TaxID=2527980 RepID=A0A517R7B3_9PLAN|nr:hypothetical protein [Stratiformator vulcanicus]QDT39711.1 hypothetical protein Pan189_41200 [Stratiformator vulcanicus]